VKIEETGFFPNLSMIGNNFHKNPVCWPLVKIEETGFFPNLSMIANNFGKNPVSGHS
jgi:hypothetical protein